MWYVVRHLFSAKIEEEGKKKVVMGKLWSEVEEDFLYGLVQKEGVEPRNFVTFAASYWGGKYQLKGADGKLYDVPKRRSTALQSR